MSDLQEFLLYDTDGTSFQKFVELYRRTLKYWWNPRALFDVQSKLFKSLNHYKGDTVGPMCVAHSVYVSFILGSYLYLVLEAIRTMVKLAGQG